MTIIMSSIVMCIIIRGATCRWCCIALCWTLSILYKICNVCRDYWIWWWWFTTVLTILINLAITRNIRWCTARNYTPRNKGTKVLVTIGSCIWSLFGFTYWWCRWYSFWFEINRFTESMIVNCCWIGCWIWSWAAGAWIYIKAKEKTKGMTH